MSVSLADLQSPLIDPSGPPLVLYVFQCEGLPQIVSIYQRVGLAECAAKFNGVLSVQWPAWIGSQALSASASDPTDPEAYL